MNPTKYIPKNLDECFVELKKILNPGELDKFTTCSKKDLCLYHHGLGQWMRNNWGLWTESDLKEHFKAMGLWHADDMSGVIIDSFHRHLRNEPLRVEEQVKQYLDYWKKMAEDKENG
jgi:hypothetical protein